METVDFESLLTPITGGNPSGESLRYAGQYDAIQTARRADEPNLDQGAWKRDRKVANWREVNKLATEALVNKSKDIQIAVWLTEALVKQQGFAGARDGLRLLRELHERFWDTLYPIPEDGDLEVRAGALEGLNDKLPASISEIPITPPKSTGEGYSLMHWHESQELGRKNVEAQQAAIAEGKITGEQWDKAVALGNRAFYESLLMELNESFEECEKLAVIVDQKFGHDAPSLTGVKKILEDCRLLVENIVKTTPEVESEPTATSPLLNGNQAAQGPPAESAPPKIATTTNLHGTTSLEPKDRPDALRRLEAIAAFFHLTEPHSPVAYLVQRAVRWGQMPLEEWLNDVISDPTVLTHIRETLGIKNPGQTSG
jgi:type VI secretion system protein ImpA